MFHRSIPAVVTLLSLTAVVAACSSSSSPTASGKTPGKKTTAAPAPKPTAKPTAKPTTPTKPPPKAPPATPPKAPALDDPTELATNEQALDLAIDCAAIGLADGQGYCLPDTDYLVGCVGGKAKALDCGTYDTKDSLNSCEDTAKAGCFFATLSPVAADIADDGKEWGEAVGTCRAPDAQEGRGFCSSDGIDVYVCKGGTLYAISCASYDPAGQLCKIAAGEVTCQ